MIDLSSYIDSLEHKRVAVFGLGLSGLSSVQALIKSGAEVAAWDDNKDSQDKARALGADIQDLTKIELNDFDFLLLAPGVPYSYDYGHKRKINHNCFNDAYVEPVRRSRRYGRQHW